MTILVPDRQVAQPATPIRKLVEQLAPENGLAFPTEPIWRLSVEQYHAMIDHEILTDADPVELLEGWLVLKMSKKPPHALATELVRDALAALLPAGWHVSSQEPITTPDSEPEPDVIVVRGERRQFADRHPHPEDLGLVVEVADASRQRDQGIKKQLYARAGIVAYWIINLLAVQVEVYTIPAPQAQPPDYLEQMVYKPGDEIPVLLDGIEIGRIGVREVLP